MATAAITPPPGEDMTNAPPPPDPGAASASSMGAATAPPQPAPQVESGSKLAMKIIGELRTLAKAFPGTAPPIAQIHDLMRDVFNAIMHHGTPGTAAAPPTG